jgi:hypothetical protein
MAKIEILFGGPTTQEREDQIEELIFDLNINLETALIMRTKFLYQWLVKKDGDNTNYFDWFVSSELNQSVLLPKIGFGVYKHNGFVLPKFVINGFYLTAIEVNKKYFIENNLLDKLGNELEDEFEFHYYGFKRIGRAIADKHDVIYHLRNKPHIYHSGEFLEVQKGR